ncbi:MAG TPA: nuclear transport factor 2 family protein [Pirellulales bacterium]|jgi:pyroglutamyl-peptidase|nr:nuclear transport factor 2 family protein [Pirellulales bacterium]
MKKTCVWRSGKGWRTRRLSLLTGLFSLCVSGSIEEKSVMSAADGDSPPVILLTGFEPFGRDKPPNPSWEGIKDLDGQRWKEYRIVCKRLPVVWSSPLPQLQDWIAEYQPVAVFAFGEGRRGIFTLENRATNERVDKKDNEGQRPPATKIVEDGPDRFTSGLDCLALAQALGDQGYPAYVSTRAGHYLCEEALYSLEYLKSTKRREMSVLFCHVPPLVKEEDGTNVTAEYVQKFVTDLLAVWHASAAAKAAPATAKKNRPQDADERRREEVKRFVEGYFRSWSKQDMAAYGDCFARQACIQFIDARGEVHTSAKDDFVAGQREVHRTSPHAMVEVPQTIDIRFEARLAEAVVYWKLTAGPRTELGYDHFRLAKQGGDWKIVNLVFYAERGANRN